MDSAKRSEVLRQLVEHTDMDRFVDQMLDTFWDKPEMQDQHPSREETKAWVRWNVELVGRWIVDREPPDEIAVKTLKEFALARRADGTPADLVPANYRRAVRFAWESARAAATEEQRQALTESADLFFEYLDLVSKIFAEAFAEKAESPAASEEELAVRALFGRLSRHESLLPEDYDLAARLGFELKGFCTAFVIAAPKSHLHSSFGARLRSMGMLAASESRQVVGVCQGTFPWRRLRPADDAIIAYEEIYIHGDLGRALDELRSAVEVAEHRGDRGEVSVDRYLPELLLRRSPQIAERLRSRVYGPLADGRRQLARALDLLIRHDFDQASTAAALPVHRNTLRKWMTRISEVTGVDIDTAQGRTLLWLAWLEQSARDNEQERSDPAE